MGIHQTSAQTYNLLESFAGTGFQGTFGGATAVYATDPVGTDQVLKLTNNGAEIWQGLDVILPTNYRLTAATQLTMQLDVYSTTAITIAPKAQGGVAGAPDSVTTATHNGSGWQTLTFTFNQSLDGKVPANGDYSDFALHINWNIASNTFGSPDGRIFYIKNLKGLSAIAPVVPAPTVAAPTPPVRVATDVISIFSNAYSNVTLAELPTGWSQTTFTALQIQGNDTWKSVGEFLGMVTNPANGVDLSTMEKMHIDYWTPDNNPISVKIVNTVNGGDAIASLGTTVTGTWNSIDIDMSAFGSTLNKTKITQLLIDPAGPSTIYIDNFYFWKPVNASVAPSLPIDFESTTVTYSFVDFSGGAVTKIANPNSGGINMTANVAKMVKNSGDVWGGSTLMLAAPIDFSLNKIFKVKVYSPRVGAKLLLKVENSTNAGIAFQTEATCTVANAWEELSFDYSLIPTANSYQKLVFIFDNGTMGDGTANFTFLFDEIRLVPPTVIIVAPSLPIDFESTTVTYGFTDFDGGAATKIVNPSPGGINTTATVAKMVKGAGQVYAGSYLTLAAPIDFSVNKIFKVKVYSPRVGAKLLLKVENGPDAFEREATCTVANAWEELTFNYSAVSTTVQFQKLVFIFDLGTVGDGSANFTFLFDEIRLIAPTGPVLTQINLPVTFEGSTTDFTMTDFEGNISTKVVDPTDSSNTVMKIVKPVGAQGWAGTTMGAGTLGFSAAVPFTTTNKKMYVKVWTPAAGIKVRLKVEDHADVNHYVEQDVITTLVGWETLMFDFTTPVTAAFNSTFIYDKASIFFNFATVVNTVEGTYYFDNVSYGEAILGLSSFTTSNVKMYPNPTSSVFTIEAKEVVESVSLFNVLGQEVVTKYPNSNSVTIDIANLQTGVYIVKTMIGGVSSTSRIVKK